MWVVNGSPFFGSSISDYDAVLGCAAPVLVRSYPTLLPGHVPTPLHGLGALAKSLGLQAVHAKDEGSRLGLGSFKALGGSYAVARLVQSWAQEALGRKVVPSELRQPASLAIAATRTVACATDGNHGRSVAAGARLFGCRSVIFVHHHVPTRHVAAMEVLGADVVVVPGTYDDSVDECSRVSAEEGWQVVSDTSWPGYETIPAQTMQGYTVVVDECVAELASDGAPLTHIFVQGGCGGLAAAVAAHVRFRWPQRPPKIVVVEPERANCLLRSAVSHQRVRIPTGPRTIMGMLECYQPSLIAWQILERSADVFMDIADDAAVAAVRRLAVPSESDPVIETAASGAAGLAGLIAACGDAELRSRLDLTSSARVLVFITEGAVLPADAARLDLACATTPPDVRPALSAATMGTMAVPEHWQRKTQEPEDVL